MIRNVFTFFLLLISVFAFSQKKDSLKLKSKKGSFYFTFGYTRVMNFSNSTIHFADLSNNYHSYTGKNNYYDFTIYDAKATDKPDFDKIPDVLNITIPQFVIHAGYYFGKKKDMGIEFNYDHTKYVVDDNQRVHIKGQFNNTYVDKDTTINPQNFLHFEHTDGANFFIINFLKRWTLYNPSERFNLNWVAKGGAGIVFPRTDVTLFGERLNNDWHVAGWIMGIESGLRAEFLRHGVFEFTAKGCYADYANSLVLGAGNGKASHTFWCWQLTATIGFMFGI